MVLHLTENHLFFVKLGSGFGTNSRVELLVLWGLLKFALLKIILHIQIFGDSRVTVDWATRVSSLQVLLEHWCDSTRRLLD